MGPEDLQHWSELLTEEQREKLRWLQHHRCAVEARWAAADPLHDLPEGIVLEAMIDKHGVIKVRGTDLSLMFDHVFAAAKNLFDYVQEYDPGWKGSGSG